MYELYTSGNDVVVQVEDQEIKIGKSFTGKSNPASQKTKELLSLNCGNYDSGLHQSRVKNRFEELRLKLLDFIKLSDFGYLHLQDLADDKESFKLLEDLGYTGFWIPNLIYSEGKVKNVNSGIASFFDSNSKFFMHKMYISLHQGNLPNVTHYAKNVEYDDLISVNCSIYQAFIHEHQKTICILTNTYISPFSHSKDRLQNILQTVNNIKKIKADLLSQYPDYVVTDSFTGDMNIYGVNSLHGPFGLKASPWSFGLPLLSSLLAGRNYPNQIELGVLGRNLNKLGYKLTPDINPKNQTIFIEVEKYAPSFLKPLFKNKKVGWQLDLCIVPLNQEIEVKINHEPFGSFDHSSLIVS